MTDNAHLDSNNQSGSGNQSDTRDQSDTDDPSASTASRLFAAISATEHTGENRCLPCTLVNAVGVALVAVVLARRRRSLGVLAALVGGAAIWLRGYAIPGTPRFAPRLVAPLPFDIGPDHSKDLGSGSLADGSATTDSATTDSVAPDSTAADSADLASTTTDSATPASADPDPETVMTTLVETEVLIADAETLTLDDSFRTAVYDRIRSLRTEPTETLAERAAAVAGPDVEGEAHGNRILLAGGRDTWMSRSIALAEVAFVETLRDRDVDDAVARSAARPLRAFLDACPACDGPVRDTTLRDCCGGPGGVSGDPERPVRACTDCDAVVFADRS